MSSFLITGGRGRLGQALFRYLDRDIPPRCICKGDGLLGMRCGAPAHATSVLVRGHQELDVTKRTTVLQELDMFRPDVVINCAGLLSFESEMRHKEAWDVNVLGASNVAYACRQNQLRMVHISTDYVFSGIYGNYKEDDPPDPINYYGLTKVVAEATVSAVAGHALILRAPFRYDGPWPYESVFNDQWVSARWMSQVVPDIVTAALAHDLAGILHIGGPRRNILDMARESSPGIEFKVWPREGFKPVRVPRDTSLDSSKWHAWRKTHGHQ